MSVANYVQIRLFTCNETYIKKGIFFCYSCRKEKKKTAYYESFFHREQRGNKRPEMWPTKNVTHPETLHNAGQKKPEPGWTNHTLIEARHIS